jgi:hypothetical protein
MDDLNRDSSKYHQAERIVNRAKRIAIHIVSEMQIDNIYLCNIERINQKNNRCLKSQRAF